MSELPRIRQAIFLLEKNTSYKFDVNSNITIKSLKRMICFAADLNKSHLRIFHDGAEYTDEEDSTLLELFPDKNPIIFTITIEKHSMIELDESRIKVRLGNYCQEHSNKYMYFFCYDCSRSICSVCYDSNVHKNHNVMEKYDFLQSSKHLVDQLFEDIGNFTIDVGINKRTEAEQLKNKIKNIYFPQLIRLIQLIEIKQIDIIDNFIQISENSFNNFQENVVKLREQCTEGIEKLKEEIHIENLMINEEVFLIFDKKYKEIYNEKSKIYDDKKKYELFLDSFTPISEVINRFHTSSLDLLDGELNNSSYPSLKQQLNKSGIEILKKDEVIERLLSDVKRPKSSRKSKTPNANSKIGEDSSILQFDNISSIFDLDKAKVKNQIEENDPGRVILRPIFNCDEIVVYQENTDGIFHEKVKFPFCGISEFLPNCSWVNIPNSNKLYITGGKLNDDNASNYFFCYDYNAHTLLKLPDMHSPRHSHSMCHFGNMIYVVGGHKNNSTEKYDLVLQKWIKLTNLNFEEKENPILFYHENYLYSFFGSLNGNYVDSVEKLKTSNIKAKWEFVPYRNPDKINLKLIGCGVYMVDNKLMFFGGKGMKESRKKAFTFDFSTFSNTEIFLDDFSFFQEFHLINVKGGYVGQFDNETGDHFLKIIMD